jgi:hypothetical protein
MVSTPFSSDVVGASGEKRFISFFIGFSISWSEEWSRAGFIVG